jgi:4-hydroxybutyrate CoA-transferase
MSLTRILESTGASRARVDHAGVSAAEAVRAIPNGARIFVHGAAATPTPLLEALVARGDLEGITLYHLHTSGPAPFAAPDVADRRSMI